MVEHAAIRRHESQPTGMCSLGCLSRATPTAGLARLGDDQNDDKNDSHKHRVHQHHRNDILGISSVCGRSRDLKVLTHNSLTLSRPRDTPRSSVQGFSALE